MIQGGGNSGAEMQPPGLGMPMPPGSPTRLEAGQANGAEATSPTGNVNAGAPGQAGVQGRPQLRLQKSYQFQVLKTNPKEASFPCLSS